MQVCSTEAVITFVVNAVKKSHCIEFVSILCQDNTEQQEIMICLPPEPDIGSGDGPFGGTLSELSRSKRTGPLPLHALSALLTADQKSPGK